MNTVVEGPLQKKKKTIELNSHLSSLSPTKEIKIKLKMRNIYLVNQR